MCEVFKKSQRRELKRWARDMIDCLDVTPQQRAVTLYQYLNWINNIHSTLACSPIDKREAQWFIIDYVRDNYKASWLTKEGLPAEYLGGKNRWEL